jgi:hypothetical protein
MGSLLQSARDGRGHLKLFASMLVTCDPLGNTPTRPENRFGIQNGRFWHGSVKKGERNWFGQKESQRLNDHQDATIKGG